MFCTFLLKIYSKHLSVLISHSFISHSLLKLYNKILIHAALNLFWLTPPITFKLLNIILYIHLLENQSISLFKKYFLYLNSRSLQSPDFLCTLLFNPSQSFARSTFLFCKNCGSPGGSIFQIPLYLHSLPRYYCLL